MEKALKSHGRGKTCVKVHLLVVQIELSSKPMTFCLRANSLQEKVQISKVKAECEVFFLNLFSGSTECHYIIRLNIFISSLSLQ